MHFLYFNVELAFTLVNAKRSFKGSCKKGHYIRIYGGGAGVTLLSDLQILGTITVLFL